MGCNVAVQDPAALVFDDEETIQHSESRGGHGEKWPRDARWLPEDERDWLTRELELEKQAKRAAKPLRIWQALRNRDVVDFTAGLPAGFDPRILE